MLTRRLFTLLALLSLATAALVAQAPRPVTWPQSFSLAPGESAAYGVPMAQAGEISAQVQWTGVPMSIVIQDLAGKPVTPPGPLSPPTAKVSYTVSPADLQTMGAAWRVVLSVPGQLAAHAQPVATGNITVQSPPVSAAQVTAISDALRSQRVAAALPTQTSAPSAPKIVTPSGSGLTESQLRASMSTRLATYTAKLKQMVAAAAKSTAIAKPTVTKASSTAGAVQRLALPTLTAVTPAQAHAGEQVVITGTNLPTDKSKSQVGFIVADGLDPLPGLILSITTAGAGSIKYQVVVPGSASATQSYAGQVYVVPVGFDITSNSLPFQYLPALLPAITATTPTAAEPGLMLRLDGTNFAQGCEVHFLLADGSDFLSPNVQFFSPQQITATVPAYASKQPFVGQVYAVNKIPGSLVRGPLCNLAFAQTVPVVDGMSKNSGYSGDGILITGSGFRAPLEVHMLTESGSDLNLPAVASDAYSVLVHVPDRDGVATSCAYQIFIKSGGVSSNLVGFTFQPTMVTQKLDLNVADIEGQSNVVGERVDPGSGHIYSHLWSHTAIDIYAEHNADFLWGNKNNDEYFSKAFRLRNGWVVDHIDFRVRHQDPGNANAAVWDSKVGTDWPYVQVHWWDTPSFHWVSYELSIWITGPKGVPFK